MSKLKLRDSKYRTKERQRDFTASDASREFLQAFNRLGVRSGSSWSGMGALAHGTVQNRGRSRGRTGTQAEMLLAAQRR